MSLPSQSPRAAAPTRTHMRNHRRRGFRVRPIVLAGFIVVFGVGGAWWFTRGDDGSGNPLGPETAAAGDELLADPLAGGGGFPVAGGDTPEREEPVTIAQGRPSGGGETGFNPDHPITIETSRTLGESLAQAPPAIEAERVNREPTTPRGQSDGTYARAVEAAGRRLAAQDPVAARSILNAALLGGGVDEAERSQLRAQLTEINQALVFSATVVAGDPMTEVYEIVSGDRLSKLPGKLGLAIDWRLLQRVNAIADPNKIRLGQKIKLVRGPFHAVVDKSDYRLDLFAGPPEEEGSWTYIRSFRVGLGEGDSTPAGSFAVKRQSKLINPHWVNPRTGERFTDDNPENPIGERWIGIAGLGADAVKTGYGLHGTIDPGSIGQQRSMGCVRMHSADVALVYEVLVEGISRVRIVE